MISVVIRYISRIAIVFSWRYFKLKSFMQSLPLVYIIAPLCPVVKYFFEKLQNKKAGHLPCLLVLMGQFFITFYAQKPFFLLPFPALSAQPCSFEFFPPLLCIFKPLRLVCVIVGIIILFALFTMQLACYSFTLITSWAVSFRFQFLTVGFRLFCFIHVNSLHFVFFLII